MTSDKWRIKTLDGCEISAPADFNSMTTFVLLEQEDWFEDETIFVRSFVKPGMTCLDIGACYGVYSVPMAQKAKVFAFEPCAQALEHLSHSKQLNSLDNLEIISQGLSDVPGHATLANAQQPELAKINQNQGESVSLTTLDEWWHESGKPAIDFIKLDSSGFDSKILQGGEEFFQNNSPVVLFAKSEQTHQHLLDMGFDIYNYLPGLGLLVPYDIQATYDPSQINLIAARPDQADKLSVQGLLAPKDAPFSGPEPGSWHKYISSLPWAEDMQFTTGPEKYIQALDCLCAAQLDETPVTNKPGLVQKALDLLQEEYKLDQSNGSLALSLARCLYSLGHRNQAAKILQKLQSTPEPQFDIPFLPPLPEQDNLRVNEDSEDWIDARKLEALIKLRHFSGYFSGKQDLPLLKTLHQNPERDIEFQRRLALVAIRQGQKISIKDTSSLLMERGDNRNVWFWKMLVKDYQNCSQGQIGPYLSSFEIEKQHFWSKIQKANDKKEKATYCAELEKYLEKYPDDIKALSMLTDHYWSIWLPEIYQIDLINRYANSVLLANRNKSEIDAILQKVQILTQRKKGVEIGKQKLSKYENIHRGERCVIIGNGPSLNKMDLSFLKNEYTFGMNRIYLGFEKFSFHPTYHICVNPAMLQQSGPEMLEKVKCPKFFHFEAIPTLKPDDDVIYLNCRKTMSIFHTDPRHGTNFGSTVTHGALQLAYFMGFQEVILIGVDHYFATKGQPHKLIESQGDDPNHFDPTYFGKGYKWQLPDLENSEVAYRAAKYHYESVGRKIIDATLNGHCQVFEKVEYGAYFDLKLKHCCDIVGPFNRSDSVSIDETKAIAETLIKKTNQGLMIDVGAHFGTSLIHFLNNNWNILAFEPDRKNFVRLQNTIKSHPNKGKVNFDNRAVGNKDQKNVSFYVSEESSGISTLSRFHDSHIAAQNVDIVTLQTALEKSNFTHVDFLKIDTEGHDLFVLQGFPWDKYKPSVIECEFENFKTLNVSPPYSVNDLADFLLEKGYKILVSEWHPVIRYGIRHDWKSLSYYNVDHDFSNSWGNIIAFLDSENQNQFIANLKDQVYKTHSTNKHLQSTLIKRSNVSIVDSDINTIDELIGRYINLQGRKLFSVIDGGAGQGMFLSDIKRYVDVKGRIFAIEPFPGNLHMLKMNISDDSRAKIYQHALSNNEKPRYFYNPKTIDENSTWGKEGFVGCSNIGRLISEQEAHNILKRKQQLPKDHFVNQIPCITIDSIMKQNEIDELDLLKLDLQGGEYDALIGAKDMIDKIKLVWMEVITDLRPLFVLASFGFTIADTLYVFPKSSENIVNFKKLFNVKAEKVSSLDTVYLFAERKFKWCNFADEWVQIKKEFGMIQTDFICINPNIANDIIYFNHHPPPPPSEIKASVLQDIVSSVKHYIKLANDHVNSISQVISGRICISKHLHILFLLKKYRGNKCKVYVETGTLFGGSMCLVMQDAEPCTFIGIDLFSGYYGQPKDPISQQASTFDVAKSNIDHCIVYHHSYSLIKGSSYDKNTVTKFEKLGFKIDLFFIDGDHSYKGVTADFNAYKKYINPGGFVVFDNYGEEGVWPEVKQAVSDINFKSENFEVLGQYGYSFIVRKL